MESRATSPLLLTCEVRGPLALAQQSLAHSRAALRLVTCGYEDGALVLRGRVHSFFLKQLAAACVAQAVQGGLHIVNDVAVE